MRIDQEALVVCLPSEQVLFAECSQSGGRRAPRGGKTGRPWRRVLAEGMHLIEDTSSFQDRISDVFQVYMTAEGLEGGNAQ